jgi:signal transduction histidine kinase
MSEGRHSLLARQIRRHLGGEEQIPESWRSFLDAVDDAYRRSDDDRAMLERSMDLSSQELIQANAALRQSLSLLQSAEQERARLQMMGALGHLVGGLAHEVRNPLFAISGTLEAALSGLDHSPQHRQIRQILDTLQEPVSRLSELMSELLEYGKPLNRHLAEGSLNEVLYRAVADCGALAAAGGVSLNLELGAGDLRVAMIRRRLLMALTNLIQNAVQHTPRGGKVEVETVEWREDGHGWARCRVLDSGEGFRAGDLPRLFEPFFTRRRGGTGLGLSIVQRVTDEHQGRIAAANHPAGGAVMTLDLPLWAGESQEP